MRSLDRYALGRISATSAICGYVVGAVLATMAVLAYFQWAFLRGYLWALWVFLQFVVPAVVYIYIEKWSVRDYQ